MWPLDADVSFLTDNNTRFDNPNYIGFNANSGIGRIKGAGVLQNQYSTTTNENVFNYMGANIEDFFRAAPQYSRRHTPGPNISHATPLAFMSCFTRSVVSPDGIDIPETASATSGDIGIGNINRGQALWEAGTQRGKNPFYSSYDYWWEQLRLKAKDYSVVPEFRISEFIDTIDASGSQNFIDNMFELTGGSSGELDLFNPSAFFFGNDSSETKFYETYSTSEFMKHFAQIVTGKHIINKIL